MWLNISIDIREKRSVKRPTPKKMKEEAQKTRIANLNGGIAK